MYLWCKRVVTVTSQAILIASLITCPALAGEIWRGPGEIVNGVGRGGSVFLILDLEKSKARIESGPSQGEKVSLSGGTTSRGQYRWEFTYSGNELQVVLYTPNQVVVYRLRRSQ